MEKASLRQKYLSEFLGTAILLLLGLSLVILMFGEGSPAGQIIPGYKLRQCITGFLFGCVGAAIGLSPIGKASGAHINPSVTLAFRLFGKIDLKTSLGYLIAQLSGAMAINPLAFPTIVTPYGIAAVIVFLALSPDLGSKLTIGAIVLVIMSLNLILMLITRYIYKILTVFLALLGAILGIVQVALGLMVIFNNLRILLKM